MHKSYYGFPKQNTGNRRKSFIKRRSSITCSYCGRTFSYLTTMNCSHCGHVITSKVPYKKYAKEIGKL